MPQLHNSITQQLFDKAVGLCGLLVIFSGCTDAFTDAYVGGDGVRWTPREGMLEEMVENLCAKIWFMK